MANSQIRLNARPVYWRLVAFCFLWSLIAMWSRKPGLGLPRRLLLTIARAPGAFLVSLITALLLTLLLDLIVRLIVRPLAVRWHSPWTDDAVGYFHLGANERILASTPARRAAGKKWVPGTLARTNLRLWFFPVAHDIDIWSCPLSDLVDARLESVPVVARGLVQGWPDRFTVRLRSEPLPQVFAVPEPATVLAAFSPSNPPTLSAASFF